MEDEKANTDSERRGKARFEGVDTNGSEVRRYGGYETGWCTRERRSLSRDTLWSTVLMGAPSWVLDSDRRLVVGCRFSADSAGDEGLSCETARK